MRRAGWILFVVVSALTISRFSVFGSKPVQQPLPKAQNPFAGTLPPQAPCPPAPKQREFPLLSDMPVPQIFNNRIQLTPKEQLGKLVMFDTTLSFCCVDGLSNTAREACMTCHADSTGFKGASSFVNQQFGGVMPGALSGKFGKVTPPSFAYQVAYQPDGGFVFTSDEGEQIVGGAIMRNLRFDNMGSLGASVDPNEMANPPVKSNHLRQGFSPLLARKIPHRPYRKLWLSVFGSDDFDGLGGTVVDNMEPISAEERVFTHFLEACEAWVSSPEVNAFSSKDDAIDAGTATATDSEQRGKTLFFGRAQCFQCHSSKDIQFSLVQRGRQPLKGNLYTGLITVNTGVPSNPRNSQNRFNPAFVDIGLEGNTFLGTDGTDFQNDGYRGMHKVPTLRNVLKAPPRFVFAFMHNGNFQNIEDVIDFYNLRNVAESDVCGRDGNRERVVFALEDGPPPGFHRLIPPPEVLLNVVNSRGNSPDQAVAGDVSQNGQLGNLKLSAQDKKDLISFLRTLVDGVTEPQSP